MLSPICGVEAKCHQVRNELKTWEAKFMAAHGNRKPSKSEIKADPVIARKYEFYHQSKKKLQASLGNGGGEDNARSRPLPPVFDALSTPKAKLERKVLANMDERYSPAAGLSPTRRKLVFDPTPQKDGLLLGVFDASLDIMVSPSSKVQDSDVSAFQEHGTPCKSSKTSFQENCPEDQLPHTEPTQSSILATPTKRRQMTPLSQSDTPKFLQRLECCSMLADINSSSNLAALEVRTTSKSASLSRSLSSLVQDLRKLQDDEFEDEEELLQEKFRESVDQRLVQEEPEMTEQEQIEFEVIENETLFDKSHPDSVICETRNTQIARPKKGPRRTTRKTNLKPNVAKWEPEPAWPCLTKFQSPTRSELSYEDGDIPTALHSLSSCNSGVPVALETLKAFPGKSRCAKHTSRKTKAGAHANFRALKLRSKHSKSKIKRSR